MELSKDTMVIVFLITLLIQYAIFEKKIDDMDKEKDKEKITEMIGQYLIETVIFLTFLCMCLDKSLILEFIIFVLTIL